MIFFLMHHPVKISPTHEKKEHKGLPEEHARSSLPGYHP
jgi:hypothetical protein